MSNISYEKQSGLYNIVELVTKEVTTSLQNNLTYILNENQETMECIKNIPQIKLLLKENYELKTEINVLKSNQQVNIGYEKQELKSKLNYQLKTVEMQKNLLIGTREKIESLQAEKKELEKKLITASLKINTNLESNNISLQVNEINNNSQTLITTNELDVDVTDNQILNPDIKIIKTDHVEITGSSSDTSGSEESQDSESDTLILAHWEQEKAKISKIYLEGSNDIDLEKDKPDEESDDDSDAIPLKFNTEKQEGEKKVQEEEEEKVQEVEDEVEEEEEKVEEDEEVEEEDEKVEEKVEEEEESEEEEEEECYEASIKINGKKTNVYKSNTGNVYEILEDEDIGDLIGTISNGIFIKL